ncbi:MAG: dethiobiotin synthase [Alphaproteobacteria bacterium]|nr:dethiobiotin synthase [Alphaproteobacteria bacterium]
MTAYVVTGTGTGVGKTFTTCALLHTARGRGQQVRGLKPVISGWDAADAQSDTAQLIRASGSTQTVETTSLWRFAAPLSPHRAAAREHQSIDLPALTAWTRAQIQPGALTLIEGVGGVMAPLSDRTTTLDWMAALGLPVIFVTGSYLGTLSHTLTALAALHARGLNVAALVMNETHGSAVTLDEAMQGLAPFITQIPLRIAQPLVSSWCEAEAIHALEI